MLPLRTQQLAAALLAAALTPRPAAAAEPGGRPRVWAVDDGTRVRRDDAGSPLSRGEGNALWRPGEPIRLGALRAETVAFQVIVEADTEPVRGVKVELSGLAEPGVGDEAPRAPSKDAPLPGKGAEPAPQGEPAVAIERFVEHYVEIRRRSRNEQSPSTSLGWTAAARPPDDRHTGFLPDALIPIALAPAWAPYPLEIAPRETRAVWIDIAVSARAAPGAYDGEVVVSSISHGALAALALRLEVAPVELPYRPVSFIAYYDASHLAERVGGAPEVEPRLWQLLHEHHVDAFASLLDTAEVERLRPAMDGSLFTAERGYRGPGAGVAPAAVALGAYGGFGEPTPGSLRRVEAVAARLPPAIEDVVLYAVDEECESARGPGWRRLVRGSPLSSRILVGHTCGEVAPSEQDVDLVMTPAQRFDTSWTRAARGAGKKLWVYNGLLPRSGTFMIDAPLTGLLANGWIAASHDVGRWFLWETVFWHDGNRGGKGPIDPFTVAENFHNRDGDACLGDGMLLYPGTQSGPFASRSVGYSGVLPSMRLKSLRRGIQDAGYIALARAASPDAVDAIVEAAIPAALDETPMAEPVAWSSEGAAFFKARAALRALIPAGAALDRAGVRRALEETAAARAEARARRPQGGEPAGPARPAPAPRARATWVLVAVVAVGALALVFAIFRRASGKRQAR
jgi:hypothetical protein